MCCVSLQFYSACMVFLQGQVKAFQVTNWISKLEQIWILEVLTYFLHSQQFSGDI